MTKTVIPRRLLLLLSVLLLLPFAACGESPQNIRYTAKEIVYLTPGRTFGVTWQDENGDLLHTLEYQRNADGSLLMRQISPWDGPMGWALIGQPEETELDPVHFGNGFLTAGEILPAELLEGNEKTYKIVSQKHEYSNGLGYSSYLNYYWMYQKNGEIYGVEWIDTDWYSPEKADDPITVLSVCRVEAQEVEETAEGTYDLGDYDNYYSTEYATSIKNCVIACYPNAGPAFAGDAAALIGKPVPSGNEFLFTHVGSSAQTYPARLGGIVRAELVRAPAETLVIPTELAARFMQLNNNQYTFEATLPAGILPTAQTDTVHVEYAVVPREENEIIFSAADATDITITTTGVAYRYDRADGTTEYWIEATSIELAETQP